MNRANMLKEHDLQIGEQSSRLLDDAFEGKLHDGANGDPESRRWRRQKQTIRGLVHSKSSLSIAAVLLIFLAAHGGIRRHVSHSFVDVVVPAVVPIIRFNGPECTTWPYDHLSTTDNATPKPERMVMRTDFVKPKGFKVIGLIFFGRARYVDLLDCYMQENMVANGGYLDEVHFMAHTQSTLDLQWLDGLIEARHGYKKVTFPAECNEFLNFGCLYQAATSNDTLYIKLDDDISFIAKDAIPKLVESRLNNPHAFAVSANVVNSPLTDYIHNSQGAHKPYLPVAADSQRIPSTSWRASELPLWSGNETDYVDIADIQPPYRGHRWLPLPGPGTEILKTPSHLSSTDQWGYPWKSWSIATQAHYSLLENLENGETWRYNWHGTNGTWDTQFIRYKLNFIAIWGRDIAGASPIGWDDEQEIAVELPKQFNRPFLIASDALVAHYSFHAQTDGVIQTDVLDKWRAYANEKVCHGANQKIPMDLVCAGFRQGGENV